MTCRNSNHTPVMVREVLDALAPIPGKCLADGTVGFGGHSSELLRAAGSEGFLYACDRDSNALSAATERLAPYSGRFEIRLGTFSELAQWVEENRCDGVLLDLGVSSPQLDEPDRGFSFRADGPLDMRMDRRQVLTAADLVNNTDAEELARIFWEYGQERNSRRLARAIERERRVNRFETTLQLAGFVERIVPGKNRKIHAATRMFQALRISVNNELGLLRSGLEAVWQILKPGGRLVVITFHSLEDRIVKDFGRRLASDYFSEGNVDIPELRKPKRPELRWVRRKSIQPSAAEVEANPRARSAQLRVMEKI
ncbi:MAG: 16S rRNA (cytosine(1402)-N(4))-methyltransferase RsmH [Verrucomicrobia bacterium]|nr:16S rRNA (cytosine(1402)-N(4))-methyltransferase RsmH [Verrucomicrobiota bacterium]